MNERKDDVSKLTKILIHKADGGRKKDSKFWNDNIELDKNNLHDASNKTRRNKKKKPINPIYGHIFRICGVIIILGYWINFYLDYKESKNVKIIAAPKIQAYDYSKNKTQPEQSYQQKTNYISNKNNIVRPASTKSYSSTNQSNNNYKTQGISLSGKVFSWIDKNGLKHYSNTNYPQDNPTLKVQTEIKTENSATKISIQNGQIFIPVTFGNNNKQITINMVLDTGCSRTNVPYRYLNHLGATYTKNTTSIIADGSKKYGRLTKVEMIKVGPNQEYNFNINGSEVAGSQNKGLLGLDFLKKHPFKIDFDNEFIVWN